MNSSLLFVFLFVAFSFAAYDPPKMVHLALTGSHTEMVISWTTSLPTESKIEIWESSDRFNKTEHTGTSSTYLESAGWTHHAKATNLHHKTKYTYKCGNSNTGWSSDFEFETGPEAGDQGDHTFIMYGDMGIFQYAYYTVQHVSQMVDKDSIDLIYQHGDFGYGNDRDPMFYETSWNLFFNQMALPMTQVPYMVAPGNHEENCGSDDCDFYANNFTVYNQRFKMPYEESGAPTNMWFSFDYGNVHFVTVSTETDFPNCPYDKDTFGDQMTWLENDLKQANANSDIDWIIATGHQPVYCSVSSKSTFFGVPIGDTRDVQQAFEDLFYNYNVDIYIDGHVHGYERTYPTYKSKVVGTYDEDNYDDPQATTYIVNGSAGNIEGFYDDWHENAPSWSANRYWPNPEHGFGVMTVSGPKSLTWKWYNNGGDPEKDEYFDTFSITRS